MLSACRRGLAILAEHQQLLGASELRAAVTAHGRELAAIGQRTALNRGDAGSSCSPGASGGGPRPRPRGPSGCRATASWPGTCPPCGKVEAGWLDHDLVVVAQIPALRRERARLEAAVRARILRTPGAAAARTRPFTVPALLRALGSAVLIELVELDGTLHAVAVRRSGIRMHTVGSAAAAAREVDFARFLLGLAGPWPTGDRSRPGARRRRAPARAGAARPGGGRA